MAFLIGQTAMNLSLLLKTINMSDVIDLGKKSNHRWTRDPKFIDGFNYEKPEYNDVPDGK